MQVRVREVLAGLIVSIAAVLLPGLAATPASAQAPIAPAPKQPILFSHKIHAGDFKIDCQYCHADARRSTFAGIPSVKRCMGCHQIVASKDAELQKEVEKLRALCQGRPAGRVGAYPQARRLRVLSPQAPCADGAGLPAVPRRSADDDRGRPGSPPDDGLVRVLSRRAEGSARLRGRATTDGARDARRTARGQPGWTAGASSGSSARAARPRPPPAAARRPRRSCPTSSRPSTSCPGVATWFATVCRECSAGCGVLAKSREGRIVKLEGNPDHPVNRGALCASGQASLLSTYDPDRIPGPRVREGETWRAGAGRRRAEAPRRQGRGRAPGRRGPDRDADAARDREPRAPGGRVAEGGRRPAPRRLRDVRPRGSPRGEPGGLRASTRSRTTPSRTRGRSCRSARTSSRRGSRRWATRGRSGGRTRFARGTPPA